jgi:alpha-tubulin suppressor-like RCC1 family protein
MKKIYTLAFIYLLATSLYAQCWQTVSAGRDHTIAIKPNGTLWAWGYNGNGQLGDGTKVEKTAPVQIGVDSNWKTVSAGSNSSLAIKTDGTLWAWGDNLFGQLGDGTYANVRLVPTRIGTDSNWKLISEGSEFSLAIKTDGTLWAWGDNTFGQLGNQAIFAITPRQVGVGSNWAAISAGDFHTVAIKTDGTLWAWGFNSYGQLGDATTTSKPTPTKIGSDTNWQSIDCGSEFSLAIKTNGTLWAWGSNYFGKLGTGTFDDKNVPTQIGTSNNWKSISAGYYNAIAIKTDGTLWGWGEVIGTNNDRRNIATQIGTDTYWLTPSAGERHAFAFKTDGSLWAWGNGNWGKLGVGSYLDFSAPQPVTAPAPSGSINQFFCSATTINDLKVIGSNLKWYSTPTGGDMLQLTTPLENGKSYYASQTVSGCESATRLQVSVSVNLLPTPPPSGPSSTIFCGPSTLNNLSLVGTNINWYATSPGGAPLPLSTTLVDGTHYFASQTINGCESSTRLEIVTNAEITPAPTYIPSIKVLCGEFNIYTAFFNNPVYLTPTGGSRIPTETKVIDGNTYYVSEVGKCGESLARTKTVIKINRTPPPISLANEKWISIFAGAHFSEAVRDDGTRWYWGSELGRSDDVPNPKLSSDSWRFITGNSENTMGIQTNGTLWLNYNTQVGNQKDWLTMATSGIFTAAGDDDIYGKKQRTHYSAIKTDGTLWTWGSNNYGQLGDGTTKDKDNPTKVLPEAKWKLVSNGNGFTIAIRTDGTLWGWGNNTSGQLGDGTTIGKTIPVQIGTESDWQFVTTSSSERASAMGIRSDGSLWGWGDNYYGRLGDGTTETRLIPTKIGSSDWSTVTIGYSNTAAIKKDGTLWVWGFAQIPFSDKYDPIPLKVGSKSNWKTVSGGYGHFLALDTDGVLWVWGNNGGGQLGIGTNENFKRLPYQLPSRINFCGKQIALANVPVQGENIKWYWYDDYYTRVEVVDPASYFQPYSRSGHFYATQTVNGFESCETVPVFLDSSPSEPPFGRFQQQFCPGATVADLVAKGTNLKWYENYGSGFVPVTLTTPLVVYDRYKSYYVSQTKDGCESQKLEIRVNPISSPSGASIQNFCSNATISDLIATGTDIQWYAGSEGGTPLPPSFLLTDGSSYYASQTGKDCQSQTRFRVSVNLTDPLPPTGAISQSVCSGNAISSLTAVGSGIKWYSTPSGGTPLEATTILVTGTRYYASQTVNECESPTRLQVLVSSDITMAPTGPPTQTFCSKTVSNLAATGIGIKWYATAIGGTSLAATTSLANGTRYYASQTVNGCESPTRFETLVTLKNPAAPSATLNQYFCSGATVSNLVATGTGIKWYATYLGQIPLAPTTLLTNATPYYASQTVDDCESQSRAEAVVILDNTLTPSVSPTQVFCSGATISDLKATGTGIRWYATDLGGIPLAATTLLANGTRYYASQTVNDCESKKRVEVLVTFNNLLAPSGSRNQFFCSGATVSNLTATGTGIKWYASSTGGSPLLPATQLIGGVLYYASQTTNSCESSNRLEVLATINTTQALSGVPTQSFCLGATINNIALTGSTLKWYASSSGGNPLPFSTPLINNNQYFASQTIAGCESTSRFMITTTVSPIPPAPSGESTQGLERGKTIGDLMIVGTGIKWYGNENDATNKKNVLLNSTPISDGTSYFATQSVLGCESMSSFKVTTSFVTGIELIDSILEYFPNPVTEILNISYQSGIEDVTVANPLGQIIVSKRVNDTKTFVDFSNFVSGIYLIRIQSKGIVRQVKVMKY